MEAKNTKPFLTPMEFRVFALEEAIGINAIYALNRANRIKHIRIGRKILIPKSEIDYPTQQLAPCSTHLG